jgi:hypothetical protein
MIPPRYIILANPDSLRWQNYAPELTAFWSSRGVEPDIQVVSWRDVIVRDGNLDDLPAFDKPALVRMESPGRDWHVAQLLLQAGCRETGEEGTDFLAMPYQLGRLLRPGLFYAGFCRILSRLRVAFTRRPHLIPCADPDDVAEMFDKNATSARLAHANIPVPPSLTAPGSPSDLLDALRDHEFSTAYVKLNTGSSASAIAVVRPMEQPPWAISSILRLQGEMYSTRRLRRHEGEDLEAVLDFLLREGVCVQQGIRMAQIDGQNFDVRVVVIHGSPRFTIFRLSDLPMTNLHLGGRRGDVRACRAAIPTRAWLDGLDHCVETARLYRSAAVGIDLLFERGYMRHFVLEVNAFGDFFPNLTDEQGRSVARVEIEETARAHGLIR